VVKYADDVCSIEKTVNGVIYAYENDKMNYKVTIILPSSQTNDQEFSILTALDTQEDVILTRRNTFVGVVID